MVFNGGLQSRFVDWIGEFCLNFLAFWLSRTTFGSGMLKLMHA